MGGDKNKRLDRSELDIREEQGFMMTAFIRIELRMPRAVEV
jgi:hypothetical protein